MGASTRSGCVPTKFWMFQRHGTRLPNENQISKFPNIPPVSCITFIVFSWKNQCKLFLSTRFKLMPLNTTEKEKEHFAPKIWL